MPRTTPGWRPATFLVLLLLCVLPSCTTTLLWGARTSGSDERTFAAMDAQLAPVPDGGHRLAVQLAGTLPEGCGPALGRGGRGKWLVADLGRNCEAFAEIARLAAITGTKAEYLVSLYTDDEVLVDAKLDLQPEQMPAVRLVSGLRVEFGQKVLTQVRGKRATILDAPPAGGEPIAVPRLRWWEPRPNEPRHLLAERVFYTPFTLLLDVVAIPVVPLALVYWGTYNKLGGRV